MIEGTCPHVGGPMRDGLFDDTLFWMMSAGVHRVLSVAASEDCNSFPVDLGLIFFRLYCRNGGSLKI